jgi:FkbH-like protein
LQARLTDRFGDHGMISVLIVDKVDPAAWVIDTWLMSCRVLKRSVERALLDQLVVYARREGASCLLGQYIPTSKNALVAGLYSELGFEPFESSSLGSWWRLDLKRHVLADIPLRVNANL